MLSATLVGGTPARASQITATLAGMATMRHAAHPAPNDDLILWLDPAGRTSPFPSEACNVVDLAMLRPALGGVARRAAWRQEIASACLGADLVVAGSEDEIGLWAPVLERAGIPARIVAFVPATKMAEPGGTGVSADVAPGVTPGILAALAHAAAWAAGHGTHLTVGMVDAPGAAGLLALRTIRAMPGTTVLPHAAPPGAVVLDLRPDTAEDRLRTPPALVAALQAGHPVLTIVPGILAQHLEAAGAGRYAYPDGIPEALNAITAQDGVASAAITLARALSSACILPAAIAQALAHHTAGRAAWRAPAGGEAPLGPDGHVLVLSTEHDILMDVRVHTPLSALHRRGAIAGYTIVRDGAVTFSTRAADAQNTAYCAVIVHRGFSATLLLVLRALRVPFLYDLDDNLLASPQYRERFGDRPREAVRTLLREAAVLSCSTSRLMDLLQIRGGTRLVAKTIVTPNLAPAPAMPRVPGLPRAVIWASSDIPALTAARPAVEAAVRDFCLAHRIKLVCLGAPPGTGLTGPEIEHVGLLPRAAYLDYIRALSPAILVCPLETGADAETQDFVNGKSDIKMLDAAVAGLVGVYSAAAPYEDSDLPGAIVCLNTYEGWLDGLERAYRACEAGSDAPVLPPGRTTAAGLLPWVTALARARLPEPLYLPTLLATFAALDDRRRTLLEPGTLDTSHYLDTHPDVAVAVASGMVPSAYDHYVRSGFHEKREARAVGSGLAGAAWWDEMLLVINRLRRQTGARQAVIDRLQANQAARTQLRR